jgi:hypothetical protein
MGVSGNPIEPPRIVAIVRRHARVQLMRCDGGFSRARIARESDGRLDGDRSEVLRKRLQMYLEPGRVAGQVERGWAKAEAAHQQMSCAADARTVFAQEEATVGAGNDKRAHLPGPFDCDRRVS